jgi:hypothetical protein
LKVVTHTLKQGIMETCLNFYIDGWLQWQEGVMALH